MVGEPRIATAPGSADGINKWFGDHHVLKAIDLAIARRRYW
jgi:hypothetical protein